jgi:hypothetical protein
MPDHAIGDFRATRPRKGKKFRIARFGAFLDRGAYQFARPMQASFAVRLAEPNIYSRSLLLTDDENWMRGHKMGSRREAGSGR